MEPIFLEIYRDKSIFGTWRACREVFRKEGYRIHNGEVQIKHSGKWWEIVEADESRTNYLRDLYKTRYNKNYSGVVVNRVHK